ILYPAGDRETAKTLAVVPPLRGEPIDAALDDVAYPEQRLDILFQRRPAEQPDLSNIRRAMPRQATLALDRFDHRGFFAADISAGAAPHMDLAVPRQSGPLYLGELLGKEKPHFRIFVADIEVGVGRLDHPGGDQHAFDKAMRIAFQIETVLKRSGFALVGVDGEQARRRFGAHQ